MFAGDVVLASRDVVEQTEGVEVGAHRQGFTVSL